ncbi:CBS domain-containing protein [Candidatus Kaiserbacteria bacterium]|nr:CBS domain-containing protein [Candidatus Kaiserbacteria bacterium]
MKVKDVVKEAVVVSENDTFADALKALTTQPTNTLLVTDDHGKLVGEVTVADLLDAMIPDTLDGSEVMEHFKDDDAFVASIEVARSIPVSEFMSQDFSSLNMEDDFLAIVSTAIAHQQVRIPVVDEHNHPVGIISRQGLKQILNNFMKAS